MKKILFVLNSYPGKGGIESVTNTLVDYLHNYFQVYTLSLSEIPNVPRPKGIERSYMFPSDSVTDNVVFFNDLVEQLNISLIINQGMFLHLSEIIFNHKRNKKVQVISCLHGMPMYEKHLFWDIPGVKSAKPSTKLKWRVRMIFNRCKQYNHLLELFRDGYRRISAESVRTVLLCNSFIPVYCRYYDIDNTRAVISIANPLPLNYDSVSPIDWDDRNNEIVFVGRLCPEKRVDLLLQLWGKVKNKNGWKLVIVGDGESLPKLMDLCVKCCIANVEFKGYTETPEIYYKKAKFVALTSRIEGFGMCLVEAMRYGAIPVAFDVSDGVRDVVANSGGFLVKMNDNCKFAKVLTDIVNDKLGNENVSKMAYEKSLKYSVNRIGPIWVDLINQVVGDK